MIGSASWQIASMYNRRAALKQSSIVCGRRTESNFASILERVGGVFMNTHSRIQTAGVILIALLFKCDKLVAQPASQQRQMVKAGPATIQVTIKARGEPIVFVPSRGRGVEDFDELSASLGRAGYRAI